MPTVPEFDLLLVERVVGLEAETSKLLCQVKRNVCQSS